jgi:quercetin dioxygenase-like cupin family protein
MEIRNQGDYQIAGRETVAEGEDLRVRVLTLAAGQAVPWHYHSEISDRFVGLEGTTVVHTRAPDSSVQLKPGERFAVAPNAAHMVHGLDNGPCKFMIIQGVGSYDFVALDPIE